MTVIQSIKQIIVLQSWEAGTVKSDDCEQG